MVTRTISRHRGIQVNDYCWGRSAKGTREMLVQQGFAKEGPFPGDPGVQKYMLDAMDPTGRAIKIQRRSKYLFTVQRSWDQEEKSSYRRKIEQDKEVEGAKRLVESWPKSPMEFREHSSRFVAAGLRWVEASFSDGAGGGYRYDQTTIDRMRFLADQIRCLIDTGPVVKDLMLKEQHTPAIIAKSVRAIDDAKQDQGFQEWLRMQGMVAK